MSRRISIALILALCVSLAASRAHAQGSGGSGLEAVPTQGLAFGSLLPGVAETVQTGDGARRAEVVLRGEGWVDLSFMLPQAMVSPSGARISSRSWAMISPFTSGCALFVRAGGRCNRRSGKELRGTKYGTKWSQCGAGGRATPPTLRTEPVRAGGHHVVIAANSFAGGPSTGFPVAEIVGGPDAQRPRDVLS